MNQLIAKSNKLEEITNLNSYFIKKEKIIYPESDGKPMADNTKQFEWIVKIKENLEIMYANNSNVFIAGDLLWYPVEGDNKIRKAPDAMVVIGRPKGHRGSYKQWEEEGIAPQVVFEILSPGNTKKEMKKKLNFYEKYDVEEYYLYDPDTNNLSGWIRNKDRLTSISDMKDWTSPILKIQFKIQGDNLYIFDSKGNQFLTTSELEKLRQYQIQIERQRADKERERADKERQRADLLAMKLKELGVEI